MVGVSLDVTVVVNMVCYFCGEGGGAAAVIEGIVCSGQVARRQIEQLRKTNFACRRTGRCSTASFWYFKCITRDCLPTVSRIECSNIASLIIVKQSLVLVKSVFGHINYLPPEMYNIEGAEGMIIFLQCCTFEHIFLTQQQVFGGTNHTMIDFHSCKIQHTNF